jgi:uncharacterized protein YjbJ (UPF0337 family)
LHAAGSSLPGGPIGTFAANATLPRHMFGLHVRPSQQRESSMNWDRIEGNWKQFKGKVQQQWGNLTDDDLDRINGKRNELTGRLQERYGYAKDQAERQVDDWLKAAS